jgi:hypothetical protein
VAPAPGEIVDDPTAPAAGWQIRDGEGAPVGSPHLNRSEAIREMSLLAFHGQSLPLSLYGPDGLPTGDRLA